MSGESALADLLRAWRALDARTDDERGAIARLLGFELRAPAPGEATPVVREAPIVRPPPPTDLAPARPRVPEPAADEPATEVVRLPDTVFEDVRLPPPLPRPAAGAAAVTVVEPVPSLLAPAWAPAIVSRLVARRAPVGAIDVPRLIARIARREPIEVVPRRHRLVTAPAVIAVVDVSGVMPWLHDDQQALIAQLRALSRTPIDVVTTEGAPVAVEPGADGDDDELDLDRPSAIRAGHGTRVIALTDLGAGSPWAAPARARVDGWRALDDDLAARGASLLVVTPVPAARRPAALRRLRCVQWDGRTTPSAVHALVRELR